jgi:hypothetical protein
MINFAKMEQVKPTRGGARIGAGRKAKYGEPTINITLRVPVSHKDLIYKMVSDYLASLVFETKKTHIQEHYGC